MILKEVCYHCHVPFSFSLIQGGYFHESGVYTEEQTLLLSLIDTDLNLAREIAKDLCVFFHQVSVLFAVSEVQAEMIFESLDCGSEINARGNRGM